MQLWVTEAERTVDPLASGNAGETSLSSRNEKRNAWDGKGSGEDGDCAGREVVTPAFWGSHLSGFHLTCDPSVRICFPLSLNFPCCTMSKLVPTFLLLGRIYESMGMRNTGNLFWKPPKNHSFGY